jgi:hypothetical protein
MLSSLAISTVSDEGVPTLSTIFTPAQAAYHIILYPARPLRRIYCRWWYFVIKKTISNKFVESIVAAKVIVNTKQIGNRQRVQSLSRMCVWFWIQVFPSMNVHYNIPT